MMHGVRRICAERPRAWATEVRGDERIVAVLLDHHRLEALVR
jgi:hypothetical protein